MSFGMRANPGRQHDRLEKSKENCHVSRVGPFSGRRRGRLYDNQNNGFGPLYHLPITLTAHPGGVSSDPSGMLPAARSMIVPAHPAIAQDLPFDLF
jgi:hypothetical protein